MVAIWEKIFQHWGREKLFWEVLDLHPSGNGKSIPYNETIDILSRVSSYINLNDKTWQQSTIGTYLYYKQNYIEISGILT